MTSTRRRTSLRVGRGMGNGQYRSPTSTLRYRSPRVQRSGQVDATPASGSRGSYCRHPSPSTGTGLRRGPAAGTLRSPMLDRFRAWVDRWGAILPLLVAEFIVWLGFGGLLPILPIYFAEQGVDLGTLGLVIAAWPAAR